jgi:TetR/AcrR family transcriptional regulator, regulator of cefoperazone and chloramphenicol sensitivity
MFSKYFKAFTILQKDVVTLEQEKKQAARIRILEAALLILHEKKNPEAVTIRDIAEKADVGIGLINYHFKSKDRLLMEAIGSEMAMAADLWQSMAENDEEDPRENLFKMLVQLSDMGAEQMYLLKMAASFELLEGEVNTPHFIVPFVKRITGYDDLDARLVAFSLISALQSAALRQEAFKNYSGYSMEDKHERDELVYRLIDACLGKGK